MDKAVLWIVVIGLILLVSSCSKGCGDSSNDSGKPDDFSLKYAGRERLEAQLKDPGSLEIISERLVRPGKYGGDVGYECKYRAKNSFGGYVVDTFYTE